MTQPQPRMTIEQALELATRHHQGGRFHEAESIYRQILAQNPNHPDALHLLGLIALQSGQAGAAADLIRRTISIAPAQAHYHCNLGIALAACGRTDEAASAYQEALNLKPDFADAHYNLGNLLRTSGRLSEAVDAYQKALAIRPENPMAWLNLGNSHRENDQINEATEAYRRAVSIAPDLPVAHYNLALMLLLQGDYQSAWPHYEWRTRAREFGSLLPGLPGAPWDGSAMNGRRILLQTEQGFGDAIQFSRFAPALSQQGGKVVIRCQPELKRLFQSLRGVEQVVASEDPLPQYDVHSSLLSVPARLNSALESIPSDVPYLRADPELSAKWRSRLTARLKIGLAWEGQALPYPQRSIPLSSLAPLAEVKGVQFISLQKTPVGSASADRLFNTETEVTGPLKRTLLDWTDELRDFADTAALIDNLDLVISIDSAVAHLSAAMGKPTWILLQSVPDWRWMLNRADSIWYPTARLFRQSRRGEWDEPVQAIARELQKWRESRHA